MGDKKSVGCFLYALFSIIMLVLIVVANVLVASGTLKLGWVYISIVPVFLWIFISVIISKRQRANLPVIQLNAVLVEKTQENRRSGSTYFLTFAFEDDSRKTFKVELNEFAKISKNEKGLLKYKQTNEKREHWLSYIFVGFEKEQQPNL